MLRPILVLNLPEAVRTTIQSMGYEYVEDIENALKDKNIPTRLKAIIDEYKICAKNSYKIVTGASLWHEEFKNPPIAVFHEGLDKLLDGGLPVGRITELCGPPGCGKTQFCLQFSVDVQMPSVLGGSDGEILYISTDCGFGVDRLTEIIHGSIQHCQTVESSHNLSSKSLLDGVHIVQTYQLNHLIQILKNLHTYLENNKKIKLLIIDSFSLPLITEIEDLLTRSKVTADIMDVLLDNAIRYKLAVVLTNQLSTVLSSNSKPILKPSLGEGFGHRLHQRLLLDNGKIYLTKNIKRSYMYTGFEITKDGIR